MLLDAEQRAFQRHFRDLDTTWQVRCLRAAKGRTAAVLLSVLAHNFDTAMEVILRVAFPDFETINTPFLCSAGKVQKNGMVTADHIVDDRGTIRRDVPLYLNEIALRDDFRRLADELKLSDDERKGLFVSVQKWLVCDYRLDPTFDPRDPDAKRLVN